jgi:hypothetical protein
MSDVLRVQWTIIPRTAPQPWLSCSRCGETRRFRSSDKIRVNANGKRLDAWLIYKCTDCGGTWNRPILERQSVRTIEPDFLTALRASEPALTRRLAFDVEGLRRSAGRVEQFDDVLVVRKVLSENTVPPRQLEVLCAVPEPVSLRVDRLLASELKLSRSQIQRLAEASELVAFPQGSRLRRTVRHGMRLVLDLDAVERRLALPTSTLGLIYFLEGQIEGLTEIVGDDGTGLLELK